MLLADWLDLAAIATAAGMTGMGVVTGISTELSMNTCDDGTASNGREGSSWWVGLDNWWAWQKYPESVQVSLCHVKDNCPIYPSKRFFVTCRDLGFACWRLKNQNIVSFLTGLGSSKHGRIGQ